MQNDLMALLTAVLSGQGMAKQSPAPMQPMAAQQPMQPMAKPMMPRQPAPQMLIGTRPGEHGNDGGIPGAGPGTDNGNGNGTPDDGKGGGKGNNNARLSHFERQMRRIGNKGPTAYTNAMEKNLGMRKPTIGYGGKDPSAFRTGMMDSLADVLTGTPPKTF